MISIFLHGDIVKWIFFATYVHGIGYPLPNHQSYTKPRTLDFLSSIIVALGCACNLNLAINLALTFG